MTQDITKGELTRESIIQAAHTLFVRQGYHGTSMRQIAEEAGIAVGGIYNHFSGKEDIFEAVFLAYHPYHDVLPAIEQAQGQTVEEFVRSAAEQMLAALKSRPHFLNLMFIEIVEFKNIHTQELFAELLPYEITVLAKVLPPESNLRPIPIPMIIRTFVGLFISYHLTDVIMGSSAPPEFRENDVEYFVDIYLHGIIADGG
ncbi:MAG: TetR/AcrR family transcriptional regulator [Chloroflexi bacterium]|jgi:AcrR family transcriptional regulator|nr:TetR/AcrR family transcriptional regulator [Chloroflexota bacterium]